MLVQVLTAGFHQHLPEELVLVLVEWDLLGLYPAGLCQLPGRLRVTQKMLQVAQFLGI